MTWWRADSCEVRGCSCHAHASVPHVPPLPRHLRVEMRFSSLGEISGSFRQMTCNASRFMSRHYHSDLCFHFLIGPANPIFCRVSMEATRLFLRLRCLFYDWFLCLIDVYHYLSLFKLHQHVYMYANSFRARWTNINVLLLFLFDSSSIHASQLCFCSDCFGQCQSFVYVCEWRQTLYSCSWSWSCEVISSA